MTGRSLGTLLLLGTGAALLAYAARKPTPDANGVASDAIAGVVPTGQGSRRATDIATLNAMAASYGPLID